MNGVHDMGGMHGMGPLEPEPNEPVFHEPWEGRVYALVQSMGPWGRGRNWGSFRFALESIPAADYLRMSYYERWFEALLVERLVGSNLVTHAELASGTVDKSRPRPTLLPASADSAQAEVAERARFRVGQRVRARDMNPRGHTRLPRYTRGRHGHVVRDHGVFALQDTDVNGHRWVAALERLVTAKGLTDSPVLLERKEAWAEAYRHTPHGKPVTLRRT